MRLRSLLFVPAHKSKYYEHALASEADAIIFDLEDSVFSTELKASARKILAENVNIFEGSGKHLFVRINDRESGELFDDLILTASLPIDGYMYPKAHSAQDIYFIDKYLDVIEAKLKLPNGGLKLLPLIETAESIFNVLSIAKESDRTVGLAFGCEDYLGDTGGNHDLNEAALESARSAVALACRASGIEPIDTVHIKIHDAEDLARNLKIAKTHGFSGMLCLHPKEISTVNDNFTPSFEELAWAQNVLDIANESQSHYNGVVLVDGQFVGPPLIQKAEKVLNRARVLGLVK
jgi:citrate lyase subunit beta / citryl-CoA lyase